MIRAFYILKDVEGGLAFFSRERLTVIGIGENEIFNSFDEVREHYYKFAETVTSTYKIIREDYRVERRLLRQLHCCRQNRFSS